MILKASDQRNVSRRPMPPIWSLTPDRVDDPARRKAHCKWERLSASPGAAVALQKMVFEIDVRHLLSAIGVPTLVVYRTADVMHAAGSRYLGAHIPGAKVVELQGSDYFPYLGTRMRSSMRSRSSSPAFVPCLRRIARWR